MPTLSDQSIAAQQALIVAAGVESAAGAKLLADQGALAALQGQIVSAQDAVAKDKVDLSIATNANVASYVSFVTQVAIDMGVPLPITVSAPNAPSPEVPPAPIVPPVPTVA